MTISTSAQAQRTASHKSLAHQCSVALKHDTFAMWTIHGRPGMAATAAGYLVNRTSVSERLLRQCRRVRARLILAGHELPKGPWPTAGQPWKLIARDYLVEQNARLGLGGDCKFQGSTRELNKTLQKYLPPLVPADTCDSDVSPLAARLAAAQANLAKATADVAEAEAAVQAVEARAAAKAAKSAVNRFDFALSNATKALADIAGIPEEYHRRDAIAEFYHNVGGLLGNIPAFELNDAVAKRRSELGFDAVPKLRALVNEFRPETFVIRDIRQERRREFLDRLAALTLEKEVAA